MFFGLVEVELADVKRKRVERRFVFSSRPERYLLDVELDEGRTVYA